MDGMTNMAFSFIKSRIDRDTAAYLEKIEKRREAGKLGGRPKTKDISQKQEKAKKANGFSEKQNNPVTDNVNVTVNVNDNNKKYRVGRVDWLKEGDAVNIIYLPFTKYATITKWKQ